MKSFVRWLMLSLLTPLAACSSYPTSIALQRVGPAPHTESPATHEGGLVVYSAPELFSFAESEVTRHSDYVVASDDGTGVRQIQNYRDRFDENPLRVTLPPGSYKVTARSTHFGKVTVPIIIKEQQTTSVYLDGSGPPEGSRVRPGDQVKLPDGEIVGWAAGSTAK